MQTETIECWGTFRTPSQIDRDNKRRQRGYENDESQKDIRHSPIPESPIKIELPKNPRIVIVYITLDDGGFIGSTELLCWQPNSGWQNDVLERSRCTGPYADMLRLKEEKRKELERWAKEAGKRENSKEKEN